MEEPATHTCGHTTQAKLHSAGGGIVAVSGSQPQGYNGKAKNDRACGLLNILFDFATSCQFQCAGRGTQYHRFLSKSMAEPDRNHRHILALSFFPDSHFRSTKEYAQISPKKTYLKGGELRNSSGGDLREAAKSD